MDNKPPIKNKKPISKTLSLRERKFVKAYFLLDGNLTQSAIDAGYSERSAKNRGYRLFNRERVKKEIMKNRDEILKDIGITFESQIKKLINIHDACMEGRASQTGLIHPVGAYTTVDLINKMAGFYAPQQHELNNSVVDYDLLEKFEKDI